MATIHIDGKRYEVDPKQNLLHTCLSLGLNLEYFCWHPGLGSVGACRQCAVKQFKDEEDTKGRIVMACMTPASDGTRVSIRDPEAVEFRRAIIEGLMLNHPHDCPVCDEGGECHLQDMTVMTGHNYRRYRFTKRTFGNQYLGPFVNHEMNRCIQCYRCVRYYREYAGGKDLNDFHLHNTVFFGRHEDGILESEFSGNLVEICPTGVFTDATLKRHYTRKWDLRFGPSICVHCGLGCNTSPGERYGMLRRIVNRYNGQVNGYFLCDRGRYGYEFVNSERRIRKPLMRRDGQVQSVTKEAAVEHVVSLLSGEDRVIGIGSPRASLEANFALRTLVGPDRFFAGVSDHEHRLVSLILEILRIGPARSPSLHDIELSDAVLILGEDVSNVAPRMALTLRQSVRQQPIRTVAKLNIPLWLDHAVREVVQQEKGPLFIATPSPTRLDEISAAVYRAAPDDIARLGFAVAHELDPAAPAPEELPEEARSLVRQVASALESAERPLVIAGPSLNNEAVIQAAANVAWALCSSGREGQLSFTAPECNSLALAIMGGGVLPDAFKLVEEGQAETVIILENDLYRRAPAPSVDAFLKGARHVVVLDHFANSTTEKAEVVLPAGAFVESDGTLVSSEGRAQRFFRVFVPGQEIQESWRWLRDVMAATGRQNTAAWKNLDDIVAAIAEAMPVFEHLTEAAPAAEFRMPDGAKVPRAPHRYSGRTAMLANISVHEPKPPEDPDSSLSFTMEGSPDQPPSALTPFFWSPGWNSIQSLNKFQSEIAGPLRGGDPGVRMIEPAQGGEQTYFLEVPAAFERRTGEWLLVPVYHIFGSEELSMNAPAIAELSAKPYVALNPDDAGFLQVSAGEEVNFNLCGSAYRFPLRVEPGLPRGIAGVPVGLPSFSGAGLPSWSKMSR